MRSSVIPWCLIAAVALAGCSKRQHGEAPILQGGAGGVGALSDGGVDHDGAAGSSGGDGDSQAACEALYPDSFCDDPDQLPIACAPGTADCDGDRDRCEAELDTDAHCGACDVVCSEGETCMEGRCCAEGSTLCDEQCTDTATSDDHCGRCGNDCDDTLLGSTCVDSECTCEGEACADRCLVCDEGETAFCSEQGTSRCCGGDSPFGCDDAERGTQCFAGNAAGDPPDCDTLTECGDRTLVCSEGSDPQCGAEGDFACCNEAFPVFCDPATFAGSGCWTPNTLCSTAVMCPNGEAHACASAAQQVNCDTGQCE